MKKIILCTLIIFALFFIASCDEKDINKNTDLNKNASANSNDTPQMLIEDLYFFYNSPNWQSDFGNYLIKINPISKTVTSLCSDPLCFHEDATECLFFDCNNFYSNKNYVFYTVGIYRSIDGIKQGRTVKLRVYDTKTDTVREIAEYEDNIGFEFATGNYIYYTTYQYIESDSGVREKEIMFRADAKTGNIIEIPRDEKFLSGQFASIYICTMYDNKLYWEKMDMSGSSFYMTDLDGNNIEKITYDYSEIKVAFAAKCNFTEKYAYYLITDEEAFFTLFKPGEPMDQYEMYRWASDKIMYRVPLDGSSGPEFISEHIYDFIICGDKIYYTVSEDDHKPIYHDCEPLMGGGVIPEGNWNRGRLYVMNLDGTDQKFLCETIDERITIKDVKTVNGVDYLLIMFQEVIKNRLGDYSYIRSEDVLLVNASTGEVTRLSMPE